jgi:hypothetical protein
LRGGGWVIALAALLVAAIATWRLAVIFGTPRAPRIGDGRTVGSYGFDLSTCRVPRGQLVAAGFPKDGLPRLAAPRMLTLAEAAALDREMRDRHLGKFMVDKQRVVGVAIAGEARAYPLKVLTWHEIVNDTLGGVPIAVTYNPLCDSVVVFDRRLSGETLEFGVSGLLYNSNLLMFDRQSDGVGESLWSQLQFRAIAGPAASRSARLTVLPCAVLPWKRWSSDHPETTVLAPDPACIKLYKRTYAEYFGSDELRFPVAPRPPHGRGCKEPVIAVQLGDGWRQVPLAQIAERVDDFGRWQTTLGNQALTFHYDPEPATAWVGSETGEPPPVAYAFWFAWYACTTARP